MFLILAVTAFSLKPIHQEAHASKVEPAPPVKAEGQEAKPASHNATVVEPAQSALTAKRTQLRRGHTEQTLVAEKTPTREEFNTACAAHVDGLIAMILREYGPAQMETVLEHDCEHGDLFPESHGGHSGFQTREQCKRFAAQLSQNRDNEEGFKSFCNRYYLLTHTDVAAEKPTEKKGNGQPGWFGLAFLAFASVVIIGLVSFFVRGGSVSGAAART